jgi:hypothetical protein
MTLRSMLAERVKPQPLPKAGLLGGLASRTLLLWVVLVVAFLAIWHFLDDSAPPARHVQRPGVPAADADAGETKDADSSP